MQPRGSSVAALTKVHRAFGPEARREKARVLAELARTERVPADDLGPLSDALDFVRAYPDDEAVLAAARRVIGRVRGWAGALRSPERLIDSGIPGTACRYPYSYEVLQRLTARFPGALEIDWDHFDDQGSLGWVLELLFSAPESEANEYWPFGWQEWIERTGSQVSGTDLGFLLRVLERSRFDPAAQAALFETCDIPIRYALSEPGTGRIEVELPIERVHFQRQAPEKERFELAPEIQRPLAVPRPLSPTRGRAVLDTCLAALACRCLEIHPLIYASPEDVRVVGFDRGIQIVLAGVLPEFRAPLGGSFFFLVLKNGVPIAYGPAAPLFGACELGINLFPAFRGVEIRFIYAQFMRLLHHAFGVELFYLTRYGMGEGNPDAIASGAFWFYRKLGFRPTNPKVEALAQSEEARMQREPGYRSDRKMLRRLSHTEAVLDLSRGSRRPFDFGALGLAVSRSIALEHAGDRRAAVRASIAQARRALRLRDGAERGLEMLSPILALIPELESWSRADKDLLSRIARAKGAASEAEATRLFNRHRRLEAALRELCEP